MAFQSAIPRQRTVTKYTRVKDQTTVLCNAVDLAGGQTRSEGTRIDQAMAARRTADDAEPRTSNAIFIKFSFILPAGPHPLP